MGSLLGRASMANLLAGREWGQSGAVTSRVAGLLLHLPSAKARERCLFSFARILYVQSYLSNACKALSSPGLVFSSFAICTYWVGETQTPDPFCTARPSLLLWALLHIALPMDSSWDGEHGGRKNYGGTLHYLQARLL